MVAGCAGPGEGFETGGPEPARPAAPGEAVVADARVRTVQLYARGDEASLPVLALGGSDQLRLEFDIVGADAARALDVTFVHTDRGGRERLVPSEYLTGFERDDILDSERSGASVAVPYVHYTYDFPNQAIGFAVSGTYRAVVRDGDGSLLFEAPFYVTEQLAEVELGFGAAVQGGSVGTAVQPAARLRLDRRIQEYDGSRFTVCFARNGRTDRLRCAPEPSLVDLAQFQFYLPREQAFSEQESLFRVDLGMLVTNDQVVDVDRAARPPTAVLDLDYAEFGGDVRDPVLAGVPLVESVFRDVGRADTDGQYVEATFRFVPAGGRPSPRRVYVVGSFNGWRAAPDAEMRWVEEAGRYEATLLVKQGLYVYGYAGGPAQTPGLGAPSVFTAFVYLDDPRRFTDRLVAVQSAVAR